MHTLTGPWAATTAPVHAGISLTTAHAGIAFLVFTAATGLAAWAVLLNRLPRLRVWLILLAGTVIAGYATVVESLAVTSAATNSHVAAGIAIAVAVFFAAEVWRVAHPQIRRDRGHRGGGMPGGMDAGQVRRDRSRRIVHSVMALAAPTAWFAAYGVCAVALGYGTAAATDLATAITTVL